MKQTNTLLLLPSLISTTLAWTCYTPAQQDRNYNLNPPTYEPCNKTAAVSMCCATGPGRAEEERDTCIDSLGAQLCYNKYYNNYWRESCTDPTWKDPACIKLFVNGTGIDGGTPVTQNGQVISDVDITVCNDGTYCDGTGNVQCCQSGQGVYIVDGRQVNASQYPQSGKLPSSGGGGGLSTGAEAGIGVGAAVAVLAVVGLLVFCLCRRRRSKRRANQQQQQNGETSQLYDQKDYNEMSIDPEPARYQLSDGSEELQQKKRLQQDMPLVELPGSSRMP